MEGRQIHGMVQCPLLSRISVHGAKQALQDVAAGNEAALHFLVEMGVQTNETGAARVVRASRLGAARHHRRRRHSILLSSSSSSSSSSSFFFPLLPLLLPLLFSLSFSLVNCGNLSANINQVSNNNESVRPNRQICSNRESSMSTFKLTMSTSSSDGEYLGSITDEDAGD